MDFNTSNNKNKEYKIKAIQNNTVYAKKLELDHLPKLYYLVSKKNYPEEQNI